MANEDLNFNVVLNADTSKLDASVNKAFDAIDERIVKFHESFTDETGNQFFPNIDKQFLDTLESVQAAHRSAPSWMQSSGMDKFYMRDMAQLAKATNALVSNMTKMTQTVGKGTESYAKTYNSMLSSAMRVDNLLASLKHYEALEKQIGSLGIFDKGKNFDQLTTFASKALDLDYKLKNRTIEEKDLAKIISGSSVFRSGITTLNGGKAFSDKTYESIASELAPFVGGRYYVRPTNEREAVVNGKYKTIPGRTFNTDDIDEAFQEIVAARGINKRINTNIKPGLDKKYLDAYYAISNLAANGNATALNLGREARLFAPIYGKVGSYSDPTKNNLRYFGGLFAREFHDIKRGSVQYPKEFLESTVEGSKRYAEVLEIQRALSSIAGEQFSTDKKLRDEVYSQNQDLIPVLRTIEQKSGRQKNKVVPITEPGRMEMFAVPRTTFDNSGRLIYIDPTDKDNKGGYKLNTGYRKFAYDTRPEDRSLALNYSQLARDFGIRETGINGSYGFGRNEKGEFIIPQKAPIVAVRADDILERDESGFLRPRKEAINTQKAKWLAEAVNSSTKFGEAGNESDYVFAGVSGSHVLFGLKDIADKRNAAREAQGLLPLYGPDAASLFIGSDNSKTFKAISNTKRRNTEVVSRALLGYGSDRVGTLDMESLHTVAELLSGKKLSDIDATAVIDGAGIAIPRATSSSFQMRGAGEHYKGVFSSLDLLGFLLRSVVPDSDEIAAYKKRETGANILANLAKNGNQLFSVDQQGKLNGVFMPSLAFKNLGDTDSGKRRQRDILNKLIKGEYSDEEVADIRRRYMTNIFDQASRSNPDGYSLYMTGGMIKGNDNDRQMPVDRYSKLFSPEELKIAQQEGRVKKGIVNLNTGEIEKKIQAELESNGGIYVERTTNQFQSDKDYIPLTVARAMNLGEDVFRESAANYQERRAQLNDRSYILSHGLGNAKFDRKLLEDPSYLDTDEARRIIQTELNALDANEASRKLLISGVNTSLLAQPLAGSWLKDFLSLSGIDPTQKNNEFAQFYRLGENIIFAPARKEGRLVGTRNPSTPGSAIPLENIANVDLNRSAETIGLDMQQAAVSPSVIYKMNTGDFDGDTIALYGGFSDAAYDSLTKYNEKLDNVRQKYQAAQARLIEGFSKTQPTSKQDQEKIKDLGSAVVNGFYNHEKAQQLMGTYSSIIQKAFEYGGNTDEAMAVINAGAEYYDLATSQMMNEGLEVAMPEFLNQYNMQKRLFDRFTREVGEELNGGEPNFKGIFSHGLKSIKSPQTLAETRFAGIARKNGFGTNFLEEDVRNWVNRHYGDESQEVLEAAQFMGDVLSGQISGSKLYDSSEVTKRLQEYADKIISNLPPESTSLEDRTLRSRRAGYATEITKLIDDINKNKDQYMFLDTLKLKAQDTSDPLHDTYLDIINNQASGADAAVNDAIASRLVEEQQRQSAMKQVQKEVMESNNLSEAMRLIRQPNHASYSFTAAESYIPKAELNRLKNVRKLNISTGEEIAGPQEYAVPDTFGNTAYQRSRETEELVGSDYFPSTFAKAFGTLMHEAFENINKKMSGSGSTYVADTYKEELTGLVKGSIERTPELNAAFEKLEKDTGISFATLQGLISNGFNLIMYIIL